MNQSTALLAVLGLFCLYLIWRFLQVRSVRRHAGGPALAAVRDKAKSARAAAAPAERAERYVEAGDLARDSLRDANLAIGYYLRALRADPGSRHAIEALRGTLPRPGERRAPGVPGSRRGAFRRLERIYWRLLSRIPAQGPTREAWLEVWKALADLYANGYRSPVRARAIRTLLEQLGGAAP